MRALAGPRGLTIKGLLCTPPLLTASCASAHLLICSPCFCAAALQRRANNLPFAAINRLSPAQGALLEQQYVETFQSGNQIPYPNHGARV